MCQAGGNLYLGDWRQGVTPVPKVRNADHTWKLSDDMSKSTKWWQVSAETSAKGVMVGGFAGAMSMRGPGKSDNNPWKICVYRQGTRVNGRPPPLTNYSSVKPSLHRQEGRSKSTQRRMLRARRAGVYVELIHTGHRAGRESDPAHTPSCRTTTRSWTTTVARGRPRRHGKPFCHQATSTPDRASPERLR